MSASHVFVDSYLKGREICSKTPHQRSQKEHTSLQQWLLERSSLFKTSTEAGFHKVCNDASLKLVKQDQIIYQQEDVVDNFFIILRGSVSLMFDSQFHAKAAAKLNQMLTDPNGQRSFLGKIVASRKAPTKASLGAEVEVLRPGNYFGQEGLLQKDEVTSFSSVANEYTELLMIDSSTFNDVFLAHFEKDLYDKALCLVNLDIFSNWSPNLLRQLALSVKEVHYGNSDCLYRQGMSLSHVLILKSGSVKLSTRNNSKPAQELLDQIVPPKDYLSDILTETSITKRPFKSHRRSPDTLQLSASPSVTRNTFHLRSRTLQRHSVSAPPLRKQTTSHKHSEIPKPIISFRPQEPRPHSTSQLCCLGPGDMLNHIEMLCNVKHSLFNASSLSDTVVYMVDTFTFMQLLEKKSLNSLHSLVKQTIERIQVWNDRNSSILIFKPLLEVLQQTEKRTRIAANHHTRKPKLSVVHSPEKLAYITVKHLGKYFSKGVQVVADIPKVQVEFMDIAVPLSDALIRKQFFIRQLTSKSLDASYVHVSKEHTSFDAPLPKSCNISSCSSKEIDSSALSSQNSTDEENIALIASKPLTPTSIRPSSNPIITPPEGCSNINLKDLLGCDPQKYSSATKTEKSEVLKQQYLRIGPNTPVKDQDILSNRLSIRNMSSIRQAVRNRQGGTNARSLTIKSVAYKGVLGWISWRSKRHAPSPLPRPPVNLSPATRHY